MQLLFSIGIHHIKSGQGLALIHPHIQIGIEAGGEPSFCLIKLVTADAQIGHDTIHCGDLF